MHLILNSFHVLLFAGATIYFLYAVGRRLKLVSHGSMDPEKAPLPHRIQSVLLNVVAQETLFRRPMRGFMHSLIFYGFLIYGLHTVSQMIAGNAWMLMVSRGLDPYSFQIANYIQLFRPSTEPAILARFLIPVLIFAFTIYLHIHMSNSAPTIKKAKWKGVFSWILAFEFTLILFLTATSGVRAYETIVHYFSLLVLMGLAFFAARRWLLKRPGLDLPSRASLIVILMIAVLMISTLLDSASQAILRQIPYSLIDSSLATLLTSLGLDGNGAKVVHQASWWIHILTVYAFMLYVPGSKHAHLVFAPINYFLIDGEPRGKMTELDMESEDAIWGASSATELRQSSLLDSLSCIECGRCTILCPANRTGKPLDPKKIMVDTKHTLIQHASSILNSKPGERANAPLIAEGLITEEELWACTSCYACATACPVGNDQWEAIYQMRRHLAMNEMSFEQTLQGAFVNMENQSNPWGVSSESRADWAKDLSVPVMADKQKADVLYWVGCAGSFDERNKSISRSMVQIFEKAGVDYAILGNEESCTGDSARRAGNEYLFQALAQVNVEVLNQYEFKTIVTQCPHCFNTLKNEYGAFGGNYNVIHHSEFINNLVKEGRLQTEATKSSRTGKLTYHDSCYLGRYNDIYNEPRALLENTTGIDIHEPQDHHDRSMCCGAGGAQMWMEEKYDRVNRSRSRQLLETESSTIATACPFCMIMISDGMKTEDPSGKAKVLDIAELVVETMMDPNP